MSEAAIEIVEAGHRTRLKWHRLRLRMSDPVFDPDVLALGFRIGASMELDLRVRGDGGFVVLHDEELEGETTGRGLISGAVEQDVRGLTMLVGGKPVIRSEDLGDLLTTAHPDALLQFDMKDDYEAVGESGIRHLRERFSALPCPVIMSGASLPLITAAREQLPNLLRGIDPTDALVEIYHADGLSAVERALIRDLRGETAPHTVYLAWELVVEAHRQGLDIVALSHAEGVLVDAWTYNMKDPNAGFSDGEWEQVSTLLALKVDQITTDEAPQFSDAWRKRTDQA